MRYPRTLCSIQVNNPGGGSGGGTVQTDGVTIQGDGSTGNKIAIKQVETSTRLTGAGTVASPLDVAGWPLDWFQYGLISANFTLTANQVRVYGFVLDAPVTTSKVWVGVPTGNTGANTSDIGVYNTAGTLLLNIGATILAGSASIVSHDWTQGSTALLPGRYVFAVTSSDSAVQFYADNSSDVLAWTNVANYTSSSGGALPTPVTAFPVAPVRGGGVVVFALN